jgi:hypothetical protein
VNRAGDMTPQMMLLGVIVTEAGTVADIQRRLIDMFPAAGFTRNVAHTSLPVLAAHGHVRLVREGAEDSQDFYEATSAGIGCLEQWVERPLPPPAVREAVHGKCEFAGLEDLAALLRDVRAEEKRCKAESEDAHQRLLAAQRTRRKLPAPQRRAQLGMALTMIHLRDVAITLNDRANRRLQLGNELEALIEHFAGKAD